MSAHVAIKAAIRTRWRETIETPLQLLTVWDNAPVDESNAATAVATKTGRWCRFAFNITSHKQVSIGGPGYRRFRTTGLALVQLFDVVGNGDGQQDLLVGLIQDAFRGVTIAPQIRFGAPTPIGAASLDASRAYWLRVVQIPFTADEFA